MSEWKEYVLNDYIKVKHGFAFKGEYFSEEQNENILLTPGNFKIGGGFKSEKFKYYTGDFPTDYILKEGDIIITMTDLSKAGDTLGYAAKIPKHKNINYLHNQRLGLVEYKKEGINEDFLYWVLRTKEYQYFILGSATGSTVKHTSPSRIQSYAFSAPESLEEQHCIAEILTSLDDKIELNNQMNQTLESIAQAIFKEWFVDFRFPGFDGELVDGLPKGWSMGKVGEIVEVTDFVANGSFASLKENVNLLEQNDLSVFALYVRTTDNNNNFNGNLKYVDKSSYEFLKKSTLYGNEVIISNVGDVGTVFRPPVWLQKPMTLGSNAIMIKENILCNYLYEFFSSYQGQYLLSGIVSGSAQPKFNKTSFRNLEILVPNEQIIVEFNNFYNRILDKIINNRSEIETLTELRNSLLPKLMSGKINVN